MVIIFNVVQRWVFLFLFFLCWFKWAHLLLCCSLSWLFFPCASIRFLKWQVWALNEWDPNCRQRTACFACLVCGKNFVKQILWLKSTTVQFTFFLQEPFANLFHFKNGIFFYKIQLTCLFFFFKLHFFLTLPKISSHLAFATVLHHSFELWQFFFSRVSPRLWFSPCIVFSHAFINHSEIIPNLHL